MPDINLLAVVAAALSSFLLGGLWYSPVLFGRAWARGNGMTPEQAAAKTKHPAWVFGGAFVLSLVAAFVFALFLGPNPAVDSAMKAGFAAGACWVAASFGINYLFANRTLQLWLIDGGYHTVQFTLFGLILGLWH